mmetsp:Transcript_113072/g.314715  ORF Transcript_113072/g.314715 Transcript_113072/m.314715 type:complete len:200 (-) Transcript_113072:1875-2474(-)
MPHLYPPSSEGEVSPQGGSIPHRSTQQVHGSAACGADGSMQQRAQQIATAGHQHNHHCGKSPQRTSRGARLLCHEQAVSGAVVTLPTSTFAPTPAKAGPDGPRLLLMRCARTWKPARGEAHVQMPVQLLALPVLPAGGPGRYLSRDPPCGLHGGGAKRPLKEPAGATSSLSWNDRTCCLARPPGQPSWPGWLHSFGPTS